VFKKQSEVEGTKKHAKHLIIPLGWIWATLTLAS